MLFIESHREPARGRGIAQFPELAYASAPDYDEDKRLIFLNGFEDLELSVGRSGTGSDVTLGSVLLVE